MMRTRAIRVLAVISLCLVAVAKAAGGGQAAPTGPDPEALGWMQAVLDNWERVCRRDLRTGLEPLPWITFYDDRQAWHVQPEASRLPVEAVLTTGTLRFNGRAYPVSRLEHQAGRLWVPDRDALDLAAMPTTAMPYDGERKPFMVVALPALYRRRAGPEGTATLDRLYFGATAHELTHTRQVVDAAREIAALRTRATLPESIDDNMIEREFAANADYKRAFDQEYALMPAAVQAATLDECRRAAARLLELVRLRKARFFAGDKAVYSRLEDIFLNLEGVAMWVQFRTARERAPASEDTMATIGTLMQYGDSWSQQQGLALFLLIDRLVPDWQARALSPGLPSPFDLLQAAVEPRGNATPR